MRIFALTLGFTLFLNLATTHAQNSWTNRYRGLRNNYNGANAIAVDGNGNVFVTGQAIVNDDVAFEFDYATIKYSNNGVPLWTNRYNGGPGSGWNEANAIAVDTNGNVFVTGFSRRSYDFNSIDYATTDYVTIKYSNNGVAAWTNRYNGPATNHDEASAISVDGSGNVFVAGYSTGIGSGGDYATIKYSNNGVPLWTNRYNGSGNGDDYATALAVDTSGNVFVTGRSEGVGGLECATIKYSSGGVPLWTNRYNGPGSYDQALAIAVDGSGNVIVTGTSWSGSSIDYATIKYFNDGLPLWTNRYDGPANNDDAAKAIAVDGAGNVFVTGYSLGIGDFSDFSSADYVTIKYSSDGVPVWTNRYNGPGNNDDEPSAISVDGSGNVFVTGGSTGVGSGGDYATIKYSNMGIPLWTNRYNGPANQGDGSRAIAVDGSGNVFVTGHSEGVGSLTEYATIKYAAPQPAVLGNPQVSANVFSFNLVAEPGAQFAIQVSTNLMNWDGIRQVTIPTGGSTNIVEAFTPHAGQKYYRAQRQ